MPLLNRKRRLQFTQAHQNWIIENWKNVAWSDGVRYLLRHSDGRVRICCKEHESMDPSCIVLTVQASGGGVMVWGIFSWHTLSPLVPITDLLYTTAYLGMLLTMSIPLWLQCTHLLMANSSRIMHHVTKLKSSQTGFLNMTMSSLYSNGLHSHQISIQLSTFGMLWYRRFASWMCSWRICSNYVMLSCQYGLKSLRNVSNTLLNLYHEELRQFWRQKGVQPCKVYLIKWPVSVSIHLFIIFLSVDYLFC